MSNMWVDVWVWNLGESLGPDIEVWAIFQVEMVFKATGLEEITRRVREGKAEFQRLTPGAFQWLRDARDEEKQAKETEKGHSGRKGRRYGGLEAKRRKCFRKERMSNELISQLELVKAEFRFPIYWFISLYISFYILFYNIYFIYFLAESGLGCSMAGVFVEVFGIFHCGSRASL